MRAGPKSVPTANRLSDHHALQQTAREHDQRLAALVVAARSTGVDDCHELLGMLGLSGAVGLPVIDPPPRS